MGLAGQQNSRLAVYFLGPWLQYAYTSFFLGGGGEGVLGDSEIYLKLIGSRFNGQNESLY
jgi:hypothetical protein